ncbi:MAG: hypothetical protein FJ309_03850 [Planctomycetes bacterium]|nr:hypothetical protein [Planctomycetota bacterium]
MVTDPCTLRSRVTAILAAVAFAGLPTAALAQSGQSGWLPTSWFTPSQVDPKAMFPLAEQDGPWLVLATTFRGEGARDDARRLVQELRQKHGLKAYTHEKSFDYTGSPQGLGLNPDGSPKKMRYANSAQVVEVAVLVGDFASFDDPRGQKVLARVKQLHPEALSGEGGRSRSYSEFRRMVGLDRGTGKGPLHLAFVIPNPLLPEDFFARQQIDRFVLDMNADVTHSLLDCPGAYSIRVATFTGAGSFDQSTAEETPGASRLVEAAEQAHRLTETLRRAGWPAWEFHDRESSIVCVGSFDEVRIRQPNGGTALHPEAARIVRELGPDPARLAAGAVMPRTIDGILLDVAPKPIGVPRRPARAKL